jgi:signal transduction histidine kinase
VSPDGDVPQEGPAVELHLPRLETLAELAGGIAHDFNNLLGVIMNYADFVREALESPAPAEVEAVFERARADTEAILRAAEAAAALTHQLLIVGRRDAAQPPAPGD